MLRVARLPPALPLAAAAALLWLALAPPTPDLAAQVYRATLFSREGFAIWDSHWYAGHHLPGYSLLFPPLASVVGPRVVGVAAAVASAVLFERLATHHFGPRARAGVAWFAVATCADLLIGRLTYALGVAIGLAALLALQHDRPRAATVLAAASSAGSPVAGLFVALAGTALAVTRRDRRGAALAAAALGVIVALAVAFPEGGRQPFALGGLIAVVGFSAAVAALLPPRERVLRAGAVLYAVAALAAFALHTPVGSNVTRLGAAFAGPLLLCAAAPPDRRRALVLAAAAGMAAWQWAAPVRETAKGVADASMHAGYYAGLIAALERHGGREPFRVEVPFTRGHWEAVHLARHVPLARGWETQLDTKHNALFYERGGVGINAYRAWLRRAGVRFVAVPDAPLDPAGRAEAALVALGVPFLRPVWRDAHWRLYEVTVPMPLVHGPGRMTALEPEAFALRVRRAATLMVRVRWTPYWAVTRGAGCVERAPGGWTYVRAARPGPLTVRASFSAGRLLDRGRRCTVGYGGLAPVLRPVTGR